MKNSTTVTGRLDLIHETGNLFKKTLEEVYVWK